MAKKKDDADSKAERMDRKVYEKELRKLQIELCRLQDWVKATGAESLSCLKAATLPAKAEP